MREDIGRRLGATYSCLWVKPNTWMHDWYQRRGYTYLKDYEQEDAVWMRKSLVSNDIEDNGMGPCEDHDHHVKYIHEIRLPEDPSDPRYCIQSLLRIMSENF
jgi:hypothetical protein